MSSTTEQREPAAGTAEWYRAHAGEPFDPGTGPMPGYMAGECGHRVAESEWRAGFRTCERC